MRAFSFEGETLYTTAAKWQRLTNTLVEALRVFHAAQPLAPGAEMEQVRDQLPGHIGIRLFRAIVDQLEMDRVIARDANLLRLPGHEIRMEQVDKALVEKITALLGAAPFTPPDLPRLERETGADRLKLTEVLRVMERHRTIVRVSPDLYFLRACLNTMKSDLRRHLSAGSHVTPGMFRDLFGTTRKYAIPLLEYLDREDVTVRWARRAG
ncbi:MAG: SelB C-terminal domain-containing protein [Betaproteobacteria bacterium]|nr:SelB C-terminal domain-containing protein [Betaproteobacteria bacterium]